MCKASFNLSSIGLSSTLVSSLDAADARRWQTFIVACIPATHIAFAFLRRTPYHTSWDDTCQFLLGEGSFTLVSSERSVGPDLNFPQAFLIRSHTCDDCQWLLLLGLLIIWLLLGVDGSCIEGGGCG